MDLAVMPPVSPMLAKAVTSMPECGHYEPKWDGFRCIVFRDGDEVVLGSRNERPLTRYFPEVVEALLAALPQRCVVDGEIVVPGPPGGGLDFEALLARVHPADSRVRLLAEQTPAHLVVFDLLCEGEADLMASPLSYRRLRLEEMFTAGQGSAPTADLGATEQRGARVHLTPVTADRVAAQDWFDKFEGAGLDGIVGKDPDGPYLPDKRAMYKLKHERTADCVVAGFRWHTSGPRVGSLLLGLYGEDGALHHVGVAASFTTARRDELVSELEPYRGGAEAGHPWIEVGDTSIEVGDTSIGKPTGPPGTAPRDDSGAAPAATGGTTRVPGSKSRWSKSKDPSFVALRPELVCEVAYDQMEGRRFRHTARFRSWRPDRSPSSCTYGQLERPVRFDLREVLGSTMDR